MKRKRLVSFHSAKKYHYFEPLETVEIAKLAKGRWSEVIILKYTEEKDSQPQHYFSKRLKCKSTDIGCNLVQRFGL